jgi:hypothetical protein
VTDLSPPKDREGSTAASAHVRAVLAREFWRCSGLAENAKSEANKLRDEVEAFEVEYDKWQARANELLALLGGEWPENPLPGSIE